MSKTPLWTPSLAQQNNTQLAQFARRARPNNPLTPETWPAFWQWSTEDLSGFWGSVWDYLGVIGHKGSSVLQEQDRIYDAQWFPEATLNFAENLLRRRDDETALVFWGEDKVKTQLSWAQLYDQVSQLSQALKQAGVQPGDRVAGFVPNLPSTIIAMLATTSLGAIWSSCSPDFGMQGIIDRFSQIQPKILFCADGYWYNGKQHDSLGRIAECIASLPSVEHIVVLPYLSSTPNVDILATHRPTQTLPNFIAAYTAVTIEFAQMPFSHPLYILYSSGTTGVPKCIVHSAGGTLLQHLKEHKLHSDVRPHDRVFFFTTCGWMMWNWLVSALASEATVLLYDGSPFALEGRILFDYIENEQATHFGTSAKFIDACKKAGIKPRESHQLPALRSIMSTGSPLVDEGFKYVYEDIKSDLSLASISGGTDIVSCFCLGSPILPVWSGEIQCRGLGMAVDVVDDNNLPVRQEKGELVCTRPFPAMPIGFWNDHDNSKYHAAYFDRFDNIWCHGDFCEITAHDGLIIYGRSDTTLNPGGVRIGTAEIYRQVEKVDDVMEALVIGQDWGDDVRVVLFVRLREKLSLDNDLKERIKHIIRTQTTPRHVPAKIIQVTDLPRTKSGKLVELAVRNVVHGLAVKNIEALANPEALEQFKKIEELQY